MDFQAPETKQLDKRSRVFRAVAHVILDSWGVWYGVFEGAVRMVKNLVLSGWRFLYSGDFFRGIGRRVISGVLVVAMLVGVIPGDWGVAGQVAGGVRGAVKSAYTDLSGDKSDGGIEGTPGYEDWISGVQKDMAEAEYKPSLQTKDAKGEEMDTPAWHMVNREQGMRSYVGNTGWSIGPRETKEGAKDWSWKYALASVGRGNEITKIEEPAISDITSDDKGKVTIDHKLLTEWYLNSTAGIEQGFTVAEKPGGEGELEVVAKIDTDLRVGSFSDEQITFSTDTTDELKLDKLMAWDADGKDLPAKFRYDGERSTMTIAINDAGAKYPITVDPLATSPSWTAESNQVTAYFGRSVASAGDVNGDGYSDVIVGAYLYDNGQTDEGRAFVYLGSGSGLAVSAAWTGESDQATAYYGAVVASAGDVNGDGYSDVIVGAGGYDNGQTDEGRTYVYHGGASGLSVSSAWTAESDQANANFGVGASAGDVNGDGYGDVIVGASLYDNGQSDEGRAYVYHGGASGLSASTAWTAESDQASALFGYSVASAGDVNGDGYSDVIVASLQYDNGQADEGRAYVYLGSGSGLAVSAAWTAESNQAGALFGRSVASAGDVNGDGYSDVIVGAVYFDNGQTDEGRAFVYLGSGSGLAVSAAWTGESDQADNYYGVSVASAGDVNGDGYSDVIVGAYSYDNGQADEGRAFVYLGSGSGLAVGATWTGESDQATAYYGTSVASAGDINGDGYSDVIVGAYTFDNGQTDEGRAYVYNGSASGLSTSSAWTAESDQASALFGYSATSAGDVNGDGYGDVIIGAYSFDNGQTDEGRAFVYYGSATGLAGSPAWTAESDQASAFFGLSSAGAGDVNGDGYSDVIVGARAYDNGHTDEGRVYVYHGSASGLSVSANWTAESNQTSALFGQVVASAGDVNGDGYGDVIVGAFLYDNGQTDEGRAHVYHGSGSGLAVSASWTAESDQAGSEFGITAASAGDVNGDGYSDVIIGSYLFDNGQTDEGRAFVYHGSSSGLSGSANWTAESNQASAWFGSRVSGAGDVNGDGYSDVIVSSQLFDNGQSDEGRTFVYHGSSSGLAGSAAWTAEGDQNDAYFGIQVAGAGDVNGDGYSDVAVGARGYDNGQTDEGRVYVFLGGGSGLAVSADWTAESNQTSASLGYSISSAGDVNGDGYSDVIAGAPYYDNGQTDEGRVFLYYGGGGAGALSVLPRQLTTSNAPIQLLGKLSATSFKISLKARTAYGRSKVKLQWEVKALGTAFNGTSLGTSSAWTDSTLGGTALTETVSGLSSSTRYHWRVRIIGQVPHGSSTPWYSIGPNGWNETDLVSGVVADLSVTKTVDSGTKSPGDAVAFTVTVTNGGSSSATALVVKDLLPSGVTYTSNTPSQGSYVSGTGMWTVGTVASAGSANIVINATVNAGTAGSDITNWAEVWSVTETDPDSTPGNSSTTEDDDASASIHVTSTSATVTNAIATTRLTVGVAATYSISFTLPGTRSGVLTVTFPAGFTVTSAPTVGASSGCLGTFGFTAQTMYATKTSCSGLITLGGATVSNPATPGGYYISWVNDDPGGSMVYIIDSDQVTVTANIDASITMNVGAQAAATACDGTFSGNGGTVALGVLTSGAVTSSDASSISHICTRLSTNASSGAIMTVKSLNGVDGLKSTSVPTDKIPSPGGSSTIVAGTAGYALCAGSAGGDSGKDTIPGSASPVRSSPFNGASCTSTGHNVGGLTTSAQSLWTLSSGAQNAFVRVYLKAAISPVTAAHSDYTDTLTFIGTGTF